MDVGTAPDPVRLVKNTQLRKSLVPGFPGVLDTIKLLWKLLGVLIDVAKLLLWIRELRFVIGIDLKTVIRTLRFCPEIDRGDSIPLSADGTLTRNDWKMSIGGSTSFIQK